ncbi:MULTISPECIES: TIGR02611 family protein [Streptomyces]|uniref:TIGR02611 family protein n=1 Tax=Streptomyces koelreuteriae TaxID=2838015 RepID=A0ABX8G0S0_9ACTN|nr:MULTISPECIES: TIGR02611 family protein [Streptomyces]QWB26775.1 TIGR02611 family protein [Streptomyces koelreuteriae]UUA09857.1 TIGR02611 family protein [Streptomyces koelreuteriae]UUA17462.1 TIGR02611 family protein [Streptomyces sp. CRCS-T-1]
MNTGSNEPGEVAVASDETGSDEVRSEQERGLGSRAPEFIKARRLLHVSWQVGVFIIGLAVVVAGIIMLPLPGPGWVVIFGGMAIWATEFVWAQLVLRWTKRKVTEAAQRALDPKVRRRNIILTSIGLVIVAVLVGIYVWKFGIVMPWKIKDQ